MAKTTDNKTACVAAPYGLNLRAAPDGAIKAILPKGTKVKITGDDGVWVKVQANKMTGWVMSEYLDRGIE